MIISQMEQIAFVIAFAMCIWQCSCQSSTSVETTTFQENATVTSNTQEPLTLLTTNTDVIQPSATHATSNRVVSTQHGDNSDSMIQSNGDPDYSEVDSTIPSSLMKSSHGTASPVSIGEQIASRSDIDVPASSVTSSYPVPNEDDTASSQTPESLNSSPSTYSTLMLSPTEMASSNSITGSSSLVVESSSSIYDENSASEASLETESAMPSTFAAIPSSTFAGSVEDHSSLVTGSSSSVQNGDSFKANNKSEGDSSVHSTTVLSSSQTPLNPDSTLAFDSSADEDSSVYSTPALGSSQAFSSPDTSTVLEESTVIEEQENHTCIDQACLSGMQSTSGVVSSSEHDVSFNTLTTLHDSSTSNPEISSELMISPTSSTLHEELTLNITSTFFTSSQSLLDENTITQYSTPMPEEVTPSGSVVDVDNITEIYTSTTEECCSSLFTDSASIFPATSTEKSPASSTAENNFTTQSQMPLHTTLVQETTTPSIDVSSYISTSPTSGTTTTETMNTTEGSSLSSTVMEQNTTTELFTQTTPETTTTKQTTTTTTETTTATTTMESTTATTDASSMFTTDAKTAVTTEKMLNISDAYSEYWVVTVLIVPTDVVIDGFQFRNDMEAKLSELYDEGYRRAEWAENTGSRSKRAVTTENVTIQITNVTRDAELPQVTDIVYYMETDGNITEAQVLLDLMTYFSLQKVALMLDYEVVVKAKLYTEPEPPPEEPDRKLWIIGVVFGCIIFFIGCCWFTLFVYFKCTRPSTTKRSPRTPRSFRTEVYTNEGGSLTKAGFKPNEVKGFDVVRTEVGLENEIYQSDRRSTEVKEPYRRRDGSTELEGMYSAGDGTPEKKIVPSVSPPLKNKRLKQISMESENDTEERQTDMSEDRLPLSPPKMRKPKKAKKKHNRSHRGKGKKHADGKDAPKPKIRSSVHPATSSSYGNDDDDDEEIQSPVLVMPPGTMPEDMDDVRRSLKAKTEIERQNNKRRQRSLKSEDLVKDTSDPVEMKRLQRELDSILDPSSAHSSLGSPSHENDDEPKDPKHVPLYLENFVLKKKPETSVWNAYNASDEAANISKQVQAIPPERLKHLSQISFDSDDNDSVGSGRRGRVRSAEYPSPRPASMLFGAHRSSKGKKPFNLPKDEYTSIRMSSNVIAPESKRNKRDSEQSDSGRYSSDENHDSSNGQGSSLQEAYLITDGRTTSLQDGYLVQHVHPVPMPRLSKSSSVDNPRPSVQDNSAIKCTIAKPRERVNSSDDEVDAAEMVIKEPTAPIMVASIRQELQRHVQRSPRPDTSITKF